MAAPAQSFKQFNAGQLSLSVYNASENSFGVASVIVYGQNDAILIDAQFTLADAETVAQEIKNLGKNLTTIYISHGDPDFYFGLQVFKKYFPEVTAFASPATIEHIKASAQKKLDVWGSKLGKALTSNVILPQAIKGNNFELEGQKIEVIGLDEFPFTTFVWIPSIKAVVGGIAVFGNTFHLWMADAQTAEARNKWISVLDKIASLQPTIVVPAHANADATFDITSVKHTKDYIIFYSEALKQHTTSDNLVNALKEKYPDTKFETALQLGAKVNTGEMKW
jgi:ribonuclease BN (tRNA processing enzyme)